MDKLSDFSRNLKTLRKKEGKSQTDLANAVGVSLLTIFRWENGKQQPRLDEIARTAKALNVSESELLNGSDDGKIKITLTYEWDKMKEANIDMDSDDFELILGSNGRVGLKGAGLITSHEAIDDFLARVKEQLEIALDAQVRRGVIPEA